MSISKQFKIIKRRIGLTLVGRNPFDLAYYFCNEYGLEVGARNNPYPFGRKCKIAYADIADETGIEKILTQGFRLGTILDKRQYVKIDYVLKGPKYGFSQIEDNTFDFVYSDNVLEHTPNPIYALMEQLRIARAGGFVYAVIPNKLYTFDKKRSATPINVLIKKFEDNIFQYTLEEAIDLISLTENFPIKFMKGQQPTEFAKAMIESNDGSYHFHVFDEKNTLEKLSFVCQISSASLHYFSAPSQKYIHFAICKGS
jgi:SAM-dependent methyltransferase